MRAILQDQGDDGTKPRLVNHLAYFNTSEDAASFSEYIKAEGYTLEKSPEQDAVAFSLVSPVSGDSFDQAIQLLKEKADELDGQYDGWGCPVILDLN